MGKQFSDVGGIYGAPMGRAEFGIPEQADGKIRLFRVRLDSGGYDDGGAYWGTGKPLFCATAGDYRRFLRADSRMEATAELGIERGLLAVGIDRQVVELITRDQSGRLSARGVILRQKLQSLGYGC